MSGKGGHPMEGMSARGEVVRQAVRTAITFASGWRRFTEASGAASDQWTDGGPPPFRARGGQDHKRS